MFNASGVQMNPADLLNEEAIPTEWDAFVTANSDFADWRGMVGQAVADRMKNALGLG